MTYDPSDIISPTPTNQTHIQTANGECVGIIQVDTVDISPSIHLKNYRLIPNLSHKLLYVSQLTKQLHYTVLLTSDSCIVQDAQSGVIIGRGPESGGLYYMHETTQQSQTMLTRGCATHQLWTWYRRLGHPSLSYLKHLFPSLKKQICP